MLEVDDPTFDAEAAPYVEDFSKQYEQLSLDSNQAYWDLYSTGKSDELEKVQERERELYSSDELYTNMAKWDGHITDPMLARQVKGLYEAAKQYHSDKDRLEEIDKKTNEVNEIHMNYRATYQGKEVTDTELRKVLEEEKNPALRKEAWLASNAKGDKVAPGLIELVKLRNEFAQSQGYSNFFEMRLKEQDIDPQKLYDLLDDLDKVSEAPFTERRDASKEKIAKLFNIQLDELRPWHFGYDIDKFSKELDAHFPKSRQLKILKSSYNDMGYDLDAMGVQYDLEQRPGKTQHAFCFGMSIPDDVRIIANEEPTHYFQEVLHHESGHAVYDKGIPAALPPLLRGCASSVMTEGAAMMFERLANDAAWLQEYGGVPKELAERNEEKNRKGGQSFIRAYLAYINFEKALYEDPDQDLAGLWWDLREKYSQTPKPEDTSLNGWAETIHFTGYPAYLQNYLLAEMVAAQLHDKLVDENGSVIGNPKTAEWLDREVFAQGATMDEADLLVQATGEKLNPQHYVDYVFGRDDDDRDDGNP